MSGLPRLTCQWAAESAHETLTAWIANKVPWAGRLLRPTDEAAHGPPATIYTSLILLRGLLCLGSFSQGPILSHSDSVSLCLLNLRDPFSRDGDSELPFFLKNMDNHSHACPGLRSLQDHLTAHLLPSARESFEGPSTGHRKCKVTCQRSCRGRMTKLGLKPRSLPPATSAGERSESAAEGCKKPRPLFTNRTLALGLSWTWGRLAGLGSSGTEAGPRFGPEGLHSFFFF